MWVAADVIVLALRALALLATFQAAGLALFLWAFGRDLDVAAQPVRTLARRAALVAVAANVLHHVAIPARMAGSLAGIFDPALVELVAQSSVGPAHAVRVAGLALLAVSLYEESRFHAHASAGGALLALGSFALTGHTSIHELRQLLVPLLLAHVVIAAFWFGALWPLRAVARQESVERAASILARFSAIAVRGVPLILVCGVAMALVFVRSIDELLSGYGVMLAMKTAAFAALLGLAALNRLRFVPAIAGGDAAALGELDRVVRLEWLLIAAVLVATAVLTALFSPENLHASFSGEHADMDGE